MLHCCLNDEIKMCIRLGLCVTAVSFIGFVAAVVDVVTDA